MLGSVVSQAKEETYGGDQTLTERSNPVLVPEKVEELLVQPRLVDLDLERIVRVGVYTEILDLVHRDGLVLGCLGCFVPFGKRPERSDLNLAR